jgi:dolichol-phosphate mannosyltransferase
MREISFAILAYLDAPSLPQVAQECLAALRLVADRFELIIVDDGSRDETGKVAESLAKAHPEISLVAHPENRGVGAAFDSAMSAGKYELLGYIDGDAQYSGADIAALAERIGEADVASGWRVQRADPWLRSLASTAYRWLLRALFGLDLRDVNSGLKLYRRWVIENALRVEATGAFFDAEVLIKARARHARIVEVPIAHRPRRHGRAQGLTRRSVASILDGCLSESMEPHRARTVLARGLVRALQWLRIAAGSPQA